MKKACKFGYARNLHIQMDMHSAQNVERIVSVEEGAKEVFVRDGVKEVLLEKKRRKFLLEMERRKFC